MFTPTTSRNIARSLDPDYYRFQVKGVTFLVIDSQLLGNFDNFDAQSPQPMPPQTEAESQKMLSWLSRQAGGDRSRRSRQASPLVESGFAPK